MPYEINREYGVKLIADIRSKKADVLVDGELTAIQDLTFNEIMNQSIITAATGCCLCVFSASAAELHVSPAGSDQNTGTSAAPFRTIQHAADLARPGDVITVHEGVYRERVNPPRGGESAAKRIVYQAASGGKVEIKGSEIVKNWEKVQEDVWKVTLPNAFFGKFNPYSDLIQGDWFLPQGRQHHTGAVYLNGQWLAETISLDNVLKTTWKEPIWFGQVDASHTTIWAQF